MKRRIITKKRGPKKRKGSREIGSPIIRKTPKGEKEMQDWLDRISGKKRRKHWLR